MVAWDMVTRVDVLRAVEEYDRLGAEGFFSARGFGPARSYELVIGGRRYPSKAILGAAYEVATGQRLGSGDFEGGKDGAVSVLGRLGFEVEAIQRQSTLADRRRQLSLGALGRACLHPQGCAQSRLRGGRGLSTGFNSMPEWWLWRGVRRALGQLLARPARSWALGGKDNFVADQPAQIAFACVIWSRETPDAETGITVQGRRAGMWPAAASADGGQ
jgi:hypothetical protein